MPDIYWVEWVRLGVRWRLEIQLPSADPMPGSPVMYEIPRSVIAAFGDVDIGFEKALIGLQQTGVLKIRIDLEELEWTDELRALKAGILQPVVPNVGTLDLSGESRDFACATMWTFCCDGGAGYASGSDELRNAVVIQCVQRPLPRRDITIRRPGTNQARAFVDIVMVDTFRAAVETVVPHDLARFIDNWWEARGPYSFAVDTIYRHDAVTYLRVESEPGNVKLRRYFHPLWRLYYAMGRLAEQVYQAITRYPTALLSFYSSRFGPDNRSSPYVWWDFAKWDYSRSGAPTWTLTAQDLWFCSRAYLSDDPNDTDPAKLVAGVLVQQGTGEAQQSIYRFRTAYDLLRVSCEAAGVKGLVRNHARFGSQAFRECEVAFVPVASGAADPRVIPNGELIVSELKIEDPAALITKAKVAVPGLEGDDVSEYDSSTYWGTGVENEEDENLRLLFHNCPRIGDAENVYRTYRGLTGGDSEAFSEISGGYVGVMSKGLSPWKLYYFDTPEHEGYTMTTDDVPIRVHCTTALRYGDGGADKGYGGFITTTLPLIAGGHPEDVDRWWEELWGVYVEMYYNATMAVVLAETMAHLFGNPEQRAFPDIGTRYSPSILSVADIGDLVQLGDTGNASTFLRPGRTDFDHISTTAFVKAMKISIRTGRVTADLLHVEKP